MGGTSNDLLYHLCKLHANHVDPGQIFPSVRSGWSRPRRSARSSPERTVPPTEGSRTYHGSRRSSNRAAGDAVRERVCGGEVGPRGARRRARSLDSDTFGSPRSVIEAGCAEALHRPCVKSLLSEAVLIHASGLRAAAMACKSPPVSGGSSTTALAHGPIFGSSVLALANRLKIKTASQAHLSQIEHVVQGLGRPSPHLAPCGAGI